MALLDVPSDKRRCLGAVVLGEHLAPRHFLGLAFIGAGLAAIDGRLLSWRRDAN